ncbi:MAG: HPr(Ser) kinase/phosphatase [Myxococcales bacterium]|nr:HPr(Ser) kinase/phosphatase [Myxococcales bacterium]
MSIALQTNLAPRTVTVETLVTPNALAVPLSVAAGRGGLGREIRHPRIQKSGLSLVGHFEGLSVDRVQILGQTEMSFLAAMATEARVKALDGLLGRGICCVLVTAGLDPFPEMLAAADFHGCPVVVSGARSSTTINAMHAFLDDRLALRANVHGVFVDVFGVGILLLGKSGIGKSECALELVQRGHRLVADDLVECFLRPPENVYGSATELLKNHLEVRGLGVLNIKDLFGVAAVRDRKRVDLVIHLLAHDAETTWDRLGIDDEWHELVGVKIPRRRIPVRPGKNTANIIEVAARNELLRQAGIHSARAFHARLAQSLGLVDPSTTHDEEALPRAASAPPPRPTEPV